MNCMFPPCFAKACACTVSWERGRDSHLVWESCKQRNKNKYMVMYSGVEREEGGGEARTDCNVSVLWLVSYLKIQCVSL